MGSNKRNLNAAMLYYIFDSANMHRWNDHFRPIDLTELDKQAHKAVIAWVLGKCEEDRGVALNWSRVIEHTLFSFIQRVAITDLKPPVYHEIMASNRDELNGYVFSEFSRLVPGMSESFMTRFKDYLFSEHDALEDRIIDAAHYLATRYEFDLIKDLNRHSYGIEETRSGIEGRVEEFKARGLAGMPMLTDEDNPLYKFINLLGQLRCQQRWAKAPREPKTSVLGHCIFVADAIYLHDLDCGVGEEQLYNDYYSGLFHDLPEVLTKDVITPVKNSSATLPKVIEGIEVKMFVKKVEPLLPEGWLDELRNMALTPFVEVPGLERAYDSIKACDQLAAWIEAHVSIQYGIAPSILCRAREDIRNKLLTEGRGEKIGVAEILDDFEKMEI